MSTTVVLVVAVVVVVLALLAFVLARQKKRAGLRQKFGPEYDRTVEERGKRRDAERDLEQRAERRKELDVRPLDPRRRDMFATEWRVTQEDFLDRPAEAVRSANALVERVIRERGYPVDDPEQMTRDLSVDHAHVISEYRSARQISEVSERNEATTEQLRQAMVHYRSLFAELLDDADDNPASRSEAGPPDDRSGGRR